MSILQPTAPLGSLSRSSLPLTDGQVGILGENIGPDMSKRPLYPSLPGEQGSWMPVVWIFWIFFGGGFFYFILQVEEMLFLVRVAHKIKGSVLSSAWILAKLTGVESSSSPRWESGLGVLELSTAGKDVLPVQSEQSPCPSLACLKHLDPSPPRPRRFSNAAFLELAAALPCSLENHVHLLTNDRKIESHHLQKLGRESQPCWQAPFLPC